MKNKVLLDFPNGKNTHDLPKILGGIYDLTRGDTVKETRHYLDTFDGRLYHRGMELYFDAKRLLFNTGDSQEIHVFPMTAAPRFQKDLPDAPAASLIGSVIENRALLHICRIFTSTTNYRVLNKDRKTVVRLQLLRGSRGRQRQSTGRIVINPVRGYDSEYRQVIKKFAGAGLRVVKEDLFLALIDGCDHTGINYRSKPDVHLIPQEPADKALRKLLKFLAGLVRANEDGIRQDIDVEFLHDFRVALRRSRSAIGQLKAVLPPDANTHFGKHLAVIAKQTNWLRDLDVYLESRDYYRSLLPSFLQDGLEPLFDYLHNERAAELQRVVAMLDTPHYQRILADWELFLEGAAVERTATGRKPVEHVAGRQIDRTFRKIIRDGKKINPDSEDRRLHRLRLLSKKLRYLLELFGPVFGRNQVRSLIQQLKELQDNLGRFQDLCVQEKTLMSFADRITGRSRQARTCLLAIGALIGVLHREKLLERQRFQQVFSRFSSENTIRLFQRLFTNPQDGK